MLFSKLARARAFPGRLVLSISIVVLLVWPGVPTSEAFIFTALKGAGKVAKAGKAGGAVVGGSILLDAGQFLRRVAPEGDDVWRVAAQVDEAGNLRVTNAGGGEWVVRSINEIASLPDPGAKLARREVYVADEILWQHRARFEHLPKDMDLFLVRDGKTPYRIRREGLNWSADINERMHVVVPKGREADFGEVMFRMQSRINAAPAPARTGSDFHTISANWSEVRGQTLVAEGRLSTDLALNSQALTAARPVKLDALLDVVQDADVNVVALDLPSLKGATHPVALNDAIRDANNLETLLTNVARGHHLRVEVKSAGDTHVVMRAQTVKQAPHRAELGANGESTVTDAVGVVKDTAGALADASDIASSLSEGDEEGHVLIVARSEATQTEFDDRVFPWLPTPIMWFLVVNWVCGIFTMATLWRWWTWLWPLLPFKENPRKWLWVLPAPTRAITCLAVCLPLAGERRSPITALLLSGCCL